MRINLSIAGLAAFSLLLTREASAQIVTGFSATMTGHDEVPVNASTGTALGLVSFDRGASTVDVSVTAIASPGISAHIHDGNLGVGGPILVGLSGAGTSWSASAAALTAAQVTDLLHEGLYLNYHTAAFTAGELRGQIRIPTQYGAELDGLKETPPNASLATAKAKLVLNQPAGTLTYSIEVQGMVPTVAHIHTGAAGAPGPILFPLSGGPTLFSGTTPALSDASLLDLLEGKLYLNFHSAAFSAGEIRDQIRPGGLNADVSTLGAANGIKVNLNLGAGASNAGKLYWVLGSVSGTSPGLPANGLVVPLNFDAYLLFTLKFPNNPPLATSFGFLNGAGNGSATFTIGGGGPLNALVGSSISHAGIAVDAFAGVVTYASNAHSLLVQ